MPFDYDKIKNWTFADIEHAYTEKDAILYALGVGYACDPLDRDELRFVYEDGLRVAPTFPTVIAPLGFWLQSPQAGVDWVKVVAAELSVRIHRPIPVAGTAIGRARVTDVVDKGRDKGSLIYMERKISDKASGELLATVVQVAFCRGDGGLAKSDPAPPAPPPVPEGEPGFVCDLPTLAQAALIYRLSGDPNPVHADPDVAKKAGFPKPILHGLCTYGVAAHAVMKSFCGSDPTKLTAFSARFSAPVFPGETIRTEMWRQGNAVQFRSRAIERDVVVLNNGAATLAG
ncbi:MaoC/PaaZ C-terminal domain-containing protein [Ramlibacter sp.]|uniref:MaoC/PaaZ C-terminal domain-containing protein n=1 Tax=Ramlibacter sp. TaxID=1917967 RepID=UPI003D123ADF